MTHARRIIPPARLPGFELSSPVHYLVLSLVCLALVMLIIATLVRSSFGRSLKAIRDDETAAWAFGKNVAVIKTLAVVLSAALAAVATALGLAAAGVKIVSTGSTAGRIAAAGVEVQKVEDLTGFRWRTASTSSSTAAIKMPT